MRAVVQRVKDAWITVNGGEKQYMEQGLVVLFGVNDTDEAKDTAVLAKKISAIKSHIFFLYRIDNYLYNKYKEQYYGN